MLVMENGAGVSVVLDSNEEKEYSFPLETIVRICADGEELQLIRDRFKNLRMTDCEKVVFVGDEAKFIAVNWNHIVNEPRKGTFKL